MIAIAPKVVEAVIKNRLEPAYTKAARINQAGLRRVSAAGIRSSPCAKYWNNDISSVCQEMHGISLDDTYVPDLGFADDICLLEDNAEDTQHLLDSVVHAAKNVDLKINASKTKFCSIDPNINKTCLGEQLEREEKLTFLGSSIQLNGDITAEIKLRCAKSLGAIKKLVKFWRCRDISTTIKSKVCHACIRSSLLYCCETWPLKTSDIKKLDSFEIGCAGSILRPSRPIKSSDIRGILKLDSSVSRTIQKRRLKLLGHVLRHDATTLPNSALEFLKGPDWKRPRGGMKWTWRDLVKADLSSILKPVKSGTRNGSRSPATRQETGASGT